MRTLFTTQKPEDYIMALKTIGNAGYPEFIPDCKSIMEDKSKPQIIRTQAIFSMRKIAAYSPETVSCIDKYVIFHEILVLNYINISFQFFVKISFSTLPFCRGLHFIYFSLIADKRVIICISLLVK